ncbi:MAG: tripartite tricarboxylate transporter TctB family protein [Alphaproteobacteria bacterium]|nr:tripartite tricarboxylate transporter TctB family protein [Alphaproteobacteria bacterium]
MTEKPTPQADFISALVWLAFAALVITGAWTMDRLEAQHINPYTAPGLVPGLLGVGIAIMGALLLVRAMRAGGHRWVRSPIAAKSVDRGRLWLALVLCLVFGAVLVGRGLPFWLATMVFVAVTTFLFQWPERRSKGQLGRGALVALACGAGTAAAVTLVFQEIFLVRLP